MAQSLSIVTWNVNGIRSVLTKEKDGTKHKATITENTLYTLITKEHPDIVCLQEIRCNEKLDIAGALKLDELGYSIIGTNCSKAKAGYSGTLVLAKTQAPIVKDFPRFPSTHELNNEGRVIAVEFPKFVLINVYVPNSKPDLSRLEYRANTWEVAMRQHITDLKKKYNKPVILCGDLNVAPQDIDVHNPKGAKGKHGFTTEEKEAFQALLSECDMKDAFRELHPDKVAYTWWSNFANSRARNKGWQIDKFIVSSKLMSKVTKVDVKADYYGSDHCPVMMTLALN
jgi:exodeoxyribonuclease III